MDVLKYCSGVDSVRKEREQIRRNKQAKKRKRPVIQRQRFVYVNAPPSTGVPTTETTV